MFNTVAEGDAAEAADAADEATDAADSIDDAADIAAAASENVLSAAPTVTVWTWISVLVTNWTLVWTVVTVKKTGAV